MARTERGMLGVFRHVDLCAGAIRELREKTGKRPRVYSPVPDPAIEEALGEGKSPLGIATLVGAVTGTCAGFFLAWYASHSFGLIVGGKPLNAPIPWLVIGFETTILLGCLVNFAAMLLMTGLPRWRKDPAYDERFSLDAYGVFVPCAGAEAEKVRRIFEAQGAVEIHERA